MVCLFSCKNKPNPVDVYIQEFLLELSDVTANGTVVNGQQVDVSLHSFICDAPARAFLKKVKYHNGYYSCERCDIRGTDCNGQRTFILTGTESPRTENEFDA